MEFKLLYTFGIFVLEVSVIWAVTFYKELMTWPDAVSFCKKAGGELVKDIAIPDVPQEKAWVGRRIKDGYKFMMTNGCYDRSTADVRRVPIRHGSFLECLKECLDFEYIGVENKTCYCLTKQAFKSKRTPGLCDLINLNTHCHWSSPPKLSCGGVNRMSTYRYQTQGFSLPLSYTDGTHAMLCAKWKGRDNDGGLILTGCEHQLEFECVNGSAGRSHDWNAALKICYDNKTDLPTCDPNASSCQVAIPPSIIGDQFWVGGFGYNVIEYTSDSVDVNNSSLCGTFGQPGRVVTYQPCGEKRPFICEFPSVADIEIVAIVLPVVGLVVAVFVLVICVRKFKRSRKSPALDMLSRENDENGYSTIDNSKIGTDKVLRDTDSQVGTNYDLIRPPNSGNSASDNITDDNYDHVKTVNSSDNTFQDNYDHMQITGLADKTINDNYDHMPIPNSSAQRTDGNYDIMQTTNPSAKIIGDDYDHVHIS